MKFPFRSVCGLGTLMLLAAAACASPILWTLNGVTLTDGGTVSGTFIFNPDAGIPCGSVSPCGTYSNVNIVTTNGSSRTGVTYAFICGQSVVNCTGVSPSSTEVLFLTSNVANQAGAPALAFFFTGISGLPPQGLTDSGGIIDVSNSSGNVGTVQEANCAVAVCTSPASPARFSTAGTVSATPEPTTWWLLTAGLGLAAILRLRALWRCLQSRG
jgi:hypothetical protein